MSTRDSLISVRFIDAVVVIQLLPAEGEPLGVI